MKKFLFRLMLVLIVSVQSFCSAATIEETHFNDSDKIIYPVVHVADAEVERKINYKIKEEILSFIKGLHYAAQYDNRKVLDARTSYEVACNEAGNTVILSIVMTESCYYEGATHPATWQHALNFNVATGNRMSLSYLTDVGEGVSVEELKGKLERKLREQCERKEIYLFDDALPLKNLPECFYWDENLHVHFVFQHYDVAPYAAGIIDVDIDA